MELPPRSEFEAEFREKMNSGCEEAPASEESLARLLHIVYEEFDMSDELMRYFECHDVVDYIISLFDKDEDDISGLLAVIITHPRLHPLELLYRYDRPRLPPIGERTDIFIHIAQLYMDNDMKHFADYIWFSMPELKEMDLKEYMRIRWGEDA